MALAMMTMRSTSEERGGGGGGNSKHVPLFLFDKKCLFLAR